jgi:predicted transcriptional regulator
LYKYQYMANVLDQKLYDYFELLNEAEKKSVLLLLKTFLAARSGTAESVSIEQYNKEIDEALAEVDAGNFITQEEMEKQAAKW